MEKCLGTTELLKQAGELADGDEHARAAEICSHILLDQPDHPGALYVLGCVLLKSAQHVHAIQSGKRITEICPKDPRGWGLLALIYGELHRYEESIRYAEKALACKRTDKTLSDCAYAHTNAGNWDKADKYGKEALAEAKANPSPLVKDSLRDALVSQAYVRLAKGDWASGFEGYRRTMRTKWRRERVYYNAQGQETLEWDGDDEAVVIVTGEQGLGDEIMAASVIPDASASCQKFIFDCDHRLAPLFQRSFPNIIVSPTRRDEAVRSPVMPTHHKTLFGLCELFRQNDGSFPRTSYLVPNEDYRRMFRALFNGPVIGLAWSGGLPRTGLEPRKAGLNAFLPLIRQGGEFVSLEYRDDAEEVAAFEKQHGIKIRRIPWVTTGQTTTQNVDVLASMIAACSEVVGVHTSALHLASAMGVPTTMISHRGSGWRYGPQELLWYPPTTKHWRKLSGESWRDSVSRLVEARKCA